MKKIPSYKRPDAFMPAFKTFIKDIFKYRYLIAAAAVCLLIIQIVFHKLCPVVIITGFPCPGCGITRALLLLITGHPVSAWNMNPCIYLWLVCFIIFFYLHYIKKDIKAQNLLLIITGIITIIVYAAKMYLYYPNQIPYVYFDKSLLGRFFDIFGYKS